MREGEQVTLEVFGLMGLYGVRLNAFSATNLAVTVGMATELSVHYVYAFLRQVHSLAKSRLPTARAAIPCTHSRLSTHHDAFFSPAFFTFSPHIELFRHEMHFFDIPPFFFARTPSLFET